jgi:electron transfer flavoprotein alpha subunit
MKNVLAVLIPNGSTFTRTEIEVLSAAKRVADELGGTMSAAILGAVDASWNQSCASYGASTVYRAAGDDLRDYQHDKYVAALQQIEDAAKADVILLPSTTYGMEVAPVFAYRIGASATMDCIGLKGDASDGSLTITKPVYGGKANSELVTKTGPTVIAMRMRSVVPATPSSDSQSNVVEVPMTFDASRARTRIVERLSENTGAAKLEDARVIVSGGRGLGGPEAFADLTALAGILGGTIGASRAACDQGWVPASLQIGQTGKKVAPDLYLAIGISGASQHMVGIAGSRHIVAINKDAKAPIFQLAACGVVDDFKSFLPQFAAALREYKAKNQGTDSGQ